MNYKNKKTMKNKLACIPLFSVLLSISVENRTLRAGIIIVGILIYIISLTPILNKEN